MENGCRSLNRTRVELKLGRAHEVVAKHIGLNRTRVELKRTNPENDRGDFHEFESNQSGIETSYLLHPRYR